MLLNALRGMSVEQYIFYAISAFAVVFLTMPIHEFAHAFVAVKLGDDTPKWQGRLSLNPFRHIDYIGALMIILFGFGYAKPVQINSRNFKHPKSGMALCAVAGPAANLIVAFIFLVAFNLLAMLRGDFVGYLVIMCYYIAIINIQLAVFNLLPIPPLDGSKILAVILPNRLYYKLMSYERYMIIILMILLYIGVLSTPMNWLADKILNGFENAIIFILDLIF